MSELAPVIGLWFAAECVIGMATWAFKKSLLVYDRLTLPDSIWSRMASRGDESIRKEK